MHVPGYFKYVLIDDTFGLAIGRCRDLSIMEDVETASQEIHLEGFLWDQAFPLGGKKQDWDACITYLGILDQAGSLIGKYYLPCDLSGLWAREVGSEHTVSLAVLQPTSLSQLELELWGHWRTPFAHRLFWASLDQAGRQAWLSIARHRISSPVASKVSEFVLDGEHVSDAVSFYCALGEALNGPGGYYGECLDSLLDCTRGGFGPVPPFTLHWSHKTLQQQPDYLLRAIHLLEQRGVKIIFSNE